MLELCDSFLPKTIPEYFFNRNWSNFNCILDFYRTGSLHMRAETCAIVFRDDLAFWGIEEIFLEPCCALKYFPEIEACCKEFEAEFKEDKEAEMRKRFEKFPETTLGNVRKILWSITEYPEESRRARVRSHRVMYGIGTVLGKNSVHGPASTSRQ